MSTMWWTKSSSYFICSFVITCILSTECAAQEYLDTLELFENQIGSDAIDYGANETDYTVIDYEDGNGTALEPDLEGSTLLGQVELESLGVLSNESNLQDESFSGEPETSGSGDFQEGSASAGETEMSRDAVSSEDQDEFTLEGSASYTTSELISGSGEALDAKLDISSGGSEATSEGVSESEENHEELELSTSSGSGDLDVDPEVISPSSGSGDTEVEPDLASGSGSGEHEYVSEGSGSGEPDETHPQPAGSGDPNETHPQPTGSGEQTELTKGLGSEEDAEIPELVSGSGSAEQGENPEIPSGSESGDQAETPGLVSSSGSGEELETSEPSSGSGSGDQVKTPELTSGSGSAEHSELINGSGTGEEGDAPDPLSGSGSGEQPEEQESGSAMEGDESIEVSGTMDASGEEVDTGAMSGDDAELLDTPNDSLPEVIEATGPPEILAEATCGESHYGCCSEYQNPAHGTNELGCCASSEFGCCADNLSPPKGPYEEGCDCRSTEFGCCPDERTPATGPDRAGCGCQYNEFGCCPDQSSSATGSEFEGCSCDTYEFGCCPDGESVSQGFNFEGCNPCNSDNGCCADGVTPKKTEGGEYCGCEASRYGCCLDGLTPAGGLDFLGCPNKPGASCHLPSQQGPCTNYTTKWFYDMEWGGCNRFWFGGCDPGPNQFDSEEACKGTCSAPRGAAACYLKKVKGPCDGDYNEWYFDSSRKGCFQFVYSGCLGNGNRFVSKQACEEMCTPQESVPVCEKIQAEGACAGDFPRFSFNRDTGECEAFSYSGCLGNNNRFLTMEECQSSCLHKAKQTLTDTVCKMYIEAGDCEAEGGMNMTLPRWGYDERMRRCTPFYYTGCGGNENNFESRMACEKVCPTTFPPIISLPRGEEILAEKNSEQLILPISVRANPPPKVTWVRNGQEISEFDYRYEVMSDYSLRVKHVGTLDGGFYSVTADNGIGEVAAQKLEVIVFPLFPVVTINLDKSIFKPETDVIVPCTIKGYPPPEIQWLRLGRGRYDPAVPVQEDRPHLTIETYQTSTTTTVSNLVFRNASDTDSGNYKCLARTETYPDVSSTQGIQIQYGPGERCIDRPSYKHCDRIVQYKFCGNRYYGQYCCRSCTEAGYVPGGIQVP